MTELARARGAGPLSLTEVARVEGLPLPYLEQLVGPLRRAGLVTGTRGLHGGYSLARDARELSVGEILRVLEGPISLVDCTADDYVHGSCSREAACMSGSLWQRIKVTVEAMLDATTLYDLMFDPGFAPGMTQLPVPIAAMTLSASAVPVDVQGRG